jgi:hypothetical protein
VVNAKRICKFGIMINLKSFLRKTELNNSVLQLTERVKEDVNRVIKCV